MRLAHNTSAEPQEKTHALPNAVNRRAPIVIGVVLLGFAPFADAQVTSLPINQSR
jgi:hypothetical protein